MYYHTHTHLHVHVLSFRVLCPHIYSVFKGEPWAPFKATVQATKECQAEVCIHTCFPLHRIFTDNQQELACVRACERACERASVRACVQACVRACMHACMRAHARMRACACACVRAKRHVLDIESYCNDDDDVCLPLVCVM